MTTRPRSPSALFEDSIHKISGQDSFTTTQPSSSSSKQVCVVLSQNEEAPDGVKVSFYLFILDPDKKDDSLSLHPRNSIVKFAGNYPFDMALLVVDSTLYMFGGFYPRIGWQLASYSFDLSPHLYADTTSYGHVPHTLDFDHKLKRRIRTLPTMTSDKFIPRAVFVGGKICVFSSCTEDGILRFELYDLASGQWLIVPELRFGFPDGICEVTFYAVEDNWLYICTTAGSFRIDCDRREPQWEEIQVLLPYCDGWYGNLGVIVKNGSLLLSPSFTAYEMDMDNPTKARQYFKFFEDSIGNFYPRDSSILLLPKEDKDGLRACIVEIGLKQDELVMGGRDAPVLRVSLIKFDDNDDTSLLKPTVLNARLFDMDFDIQTFEINLVGLFQI